MLHACNWNNSKRPRAGHDNVRVQLRQKRYVDGLYRVCACRAYGRALLRPPQVCMLVQSTDVQQVVLDAHRLIPKHGRVQSSEYTVLAAIVLSCPSRHPVLVSLATGTKSLPGHLRDEHGSVLHDSHAEVLARRCALRWLCEELSLAQAAPAPGMLLCTALHEFVYRHACQ